MRYIILFLSILFSLQAGAVSKKKRSLIRRVHTYATTIDTTHAVRETYGYSRMSLRVDKRNALLMAVPSAYVIAHGDKRQFLTEAFSKITFKDYNDFDVTPMLRLTTVPHRRRPLVNMLRYMVPSIYNETIVGNTILSPFHPANFRFYKYKVESVSGDTVDVRFYGRRSSTQLVRGSAQIDNLTGRIIRCNFVSDYDMLHSWISMEMGEKGFTSLFPKKCEGLFFFRFLGNRVSAHTVSSYGLKNTLTDSIDSPGNPVLMSEVRPDTLDWAEQGIYAQKAKGDIEAKMLRDADTVKVKKKSWVKTILWDAIGDNVLNRVKTHFGQNNQGYVRLNPVLNPLYMGYSDRKGFTYKFDIRASYQFDDNSELSGRLKAGYSFKLKQFYFRVPIYYYMTRRKNRYIKFEAGNGNRIGSQRLRKAMNIPDDYESGDLHLLDPDIFNQFTQGDARLILNFDINSNWGFQVGALYQQWRAVNPYAFRMLGWEPHYSSFAPVVELQYRPIGWQGPILTLDYDRAIKGVFSSNTDYERLEFNAEYIYRINRMQSLQMRLGSGCYTNKGRNAYFLNYENFNDNNIPGGWNDDWSGEFELLRGETFNTSSYYVRANITYESPLLLLSWLPWVGHYMEMERIYASWLDVERIHPYLEFGYGFTTRLFSLGFFVSNGKGNRSIGCKFGFELFRHW